MFSIRPVAGVGFDRTNPDRAFLFSSRWSCRKWHVEVHTHAIGCLARTSLDRQLTPQTAADAADALIRYGSVVRIKITILM